MNDDIRRIQEDLQRQRQEIERSASLLKNTQPKLFSGTDGTFKSPNKRFAFSNPVQPHPFKVYIKGRGNNFRYKVIKTSYIYGGPSITGLDQWKSANGVQNPFAIYVEATLANHEFTNAEIRTDAPNKSLYEPDDASGSQTKARFPIAYVDNVQTSPSLVQQLKSDLFYSSTCIDGFAYTILRGLIAI
jgi:hypothetical protein